MVGASSLFEIKDLSTLDDLWQFVQQRGLRGGLQRPVEALWQWPSPPERALLQVESLAERGGCRNLGDLISRPEVRALFRARVTPRTERALVVWLATRMSEGPQEVASALAQGGRELPVPGMPMAELRRWAAEHLVDHLLDQSADIAAGRSPDPWLRRPEARRLTLADVICAQRGRTSTWSAVPLPAQRAALALLLEQGALNLAGVKEEGPRLSARRAPGYAALAPVWRRLQQARETLRAQVPPRPLSSRGTCELTLQAERRELVYVEDVRAVCGNGALRPQVRIALGDDAAAPWVRCDCPDGGRPCPVKLSAVDHALDVLGLPVWGETAAAFARELSVPAWQRVLSALDEVLAVAPAAAPTWEGMPAERGWMLRVGPRGQPTLAPVLARARKQGQGYTTRKLSWREMAELGEGQHEVEGQREVDAQVLRLLSPHGPGLAQPDRAPLDAVHKAMRALVGHPAVFLQGKPTERVEVHSARPSLCLSDLPGGGVEVRVRLPGGDVEAGAWAREVRDRSCVGLHLQVEPGQARVWVVALPERLSALMAVFATRGARLPAEAVGALAERLPRLMALVPVEAGDAVRGRAVPAALKLSLRLQVEARGDLTMTALIEPLPGVEPLPPGQGPATLFGRGSDGAVHCTRDLALEQEALQQAVEGLPLAAARRQGHVWRIAELDDALELVSALNGRDGGPPVLWADGRRHRVSRAAQASDLYVQLAQRRDWFGLGGHLQVDGLVLPLSELLRAVRDRQRFVPVGEGAWVKIGRALREALQGAAAAGLEGKKGVRISAFAAPLMDGLQAQGARVHAPAGWEERRARLRASVSLEPALPAGLRASLRPYQVAGHRWLRRHAHWGHGACLADDMGLGKTVQALALLLDRAPSGPALVVAPTSVGYGWVREAARFAPGLDLRLFRGRAHLDRLEGLGPSSVVVTSYDLMQRHIDALQPTAWSTLVLDEAQALKNPQARRTRAALTLRAGFTLALTGTPVENRTLELWSLMSLIAPGLLGSAAEFHARFALPIERQGDQQVRSTLAALVRPFILRRMKSEVATELPSRTDVQVDVALSPPERRAYDALRASVLTALKRAADGVTPHRRRFEVLAALTRLRQLACHPRLQDPDSTVPSSKLELLRQLVGQLKEEGHRALIFSQFTSLLALVREALEADGVRYRYLDGGTPEKQRRAEIDAFQGGDGEVFLLSLKAGGTGLNLTAADYVVHLDPWWNPAVEDQATDRAHRIGQTRPVTVLRLVTRGTIEEAIVALHDEKRALVAALLAGTGKAATLSTEELMALIGHEEHDPVGLEEGAADGASLPARSSRPAALQSPRTPSVPAPSAPAPSAPAPAATARSAEPRAALEAAPSLFSPPGPSSPQAPGTAVGQQAALGALLERARAERRLGTDRTVRSYRRVGRRMAEFFDARALTPTAANLADLTETYLREVHAGRWHAPPSEPGFARSVARWWAESLGDGHRSA